MQVKVLTIESRQRQGVSQMASLNDFTCLASDETTDVQQLIENPNVSLYCLDYDQQLAIVAELAAGIDLSQAPFYYQTQFDNAVRLIAVPFETFFALAEEMPFDFSRLIFIHNIGRCGSTLLHQIFNAVDGVLSFSEPDALSNFVSFRYRDRATLIQLLHHSVPMLFRPVLTGQSNRHCIKLRNQCIEIMDLYTEAFPQARHLFLYRNVLDWAASLYRLSLRHGPRPNISRVEAQEKLAAYHNRPVSDVESFFDPDIDSYSRVTYLATSWLAMMDRYLEVFSGKAPLLAIRYEDLAAQPERVVEAIFAYCGLPQQGLSQALETLTRDSQEGTVLARAQAQEGNSVKLPEDDVIQIQALLRRHPVIHDPDYILPGTLRFN